MSTIKTEGDINITPLRNEWNEKHDLTTKEWLLEDERYFLHQSMSTPCLDVIQTCYGSSFENLKGKKYIDFHGNNVHQLGYAHPRLKKAIHEQMETLSFSPRRYTNKAAIRFARKMASVCPGDLNRILMTPNGSSAISIALKIARGITGKHKLISFWDSFHGANLDAIGVGGEHVFRDKMGPLMPGVERVPGPATYRGIFADQPEKYLEYLEMVVEKEGDIGAILAETIRNTDVQIGDHSFWKGLRQLCDKHGILLILDEIPIAIGRTGKLFAFENFGIEPDILCLGKGLGGGLFPQACVVTRDKFNVFQDISLGHYTHEKSPIGAAVGFAILETLEEDQILENVHKREAYLKDRLNAMQSRFPIIGDIRGIGMLWGVELVRDKTTKEKATDEAEKVLYSCLDKGLSFKISGGNVLQLSPALTITEGELKEALDILEKSLLTIT
ncbi:(R)-1-hydroxy-2-aminoethylphosphonate ammonia-lyase [Marinifilum sp.]|uniref:(R)-1-hydroxy-2-aminoethylphosphonate ammonia-lyase n=1 Tax=Marinifilum sp. TaxID=2033137 RepID=UPI003BACA435